MGLLGMKLGEDPGSALDRLQQNGIRVSTVITNGFDLEDRSSWAQTRNHLNAMLDVVAAVGGWSVYITSGPTTGAVWDVVCDTFAEAVAPCVMHAQKVGVVLAFEPSLRTDVSFVHTIRDAIDVAKRTGIGIVVDLGNCWMERDFRGVLLEAAPHIALVQVSDCLYRRNAVSVVAAPLGRVPFGEGELPIARLMQDIKDTGYQGPIELELPGPLGEAEGYGPVIKRGAQALSETLYAMNF